MAQIISWIARAPVITTRAAPFPNPGSGLALNAASQARWGGCRPDLTASKCAKVVVFTATVRKG
ncbi:MAG: hypothetical protein JJU19_04075, partial [Pararhodobacter sp.]|nr:hypothetical protein [Pararhodobacter sp.]